MRSSSKRAAANSPTDPILDEAKRRVRAAGAAFLRAVEVVRGETRAAQRILKGHPDYKRAKAARDQGPDYGPEGYSPAWWLHQHCRGVDDPSDGDLGHTERQARFLLQMGSDDGVEKDLARFLRDEDESRKRFERRNERHRLRKVAAAMTTATLEKLGTDLHEAAKVLRDAMGEMKVVLEEEEYPPTA